MINVLPRLDSLLRFHRKRALRDTRSRVEKYFINRLSCCRLELCQGRRYSAGGDFREENGEEGREADEREEVERQLAHPAIHVLQHS